MIGQDINKHCVERERALTIYAIYLHVERFEKQEAETSEVDLDPPVEPVVPGCFDPRVGSGSGFFPLTLLLRGCFLPLPLGGTACPSVSFSFFAIY